MRHLTRRTALGLLLVVVLTLTATAAPPWLRQAGAQAFPAIKAVGLFTFQGDWAKMLLDSFEDPTVKKSMELLKPKQLKLIDDFRAAGELPENISTEFVGTMSEVLSGLEKIIVTSEALRAALLAGGAAATLSELRRRFDEYLSILTRGKDTTKIRIVLE